MCAFYVGRPVTGNFKARLPVVDIKDCKVERSGNQLYLVKQDSERVALLPLDSEGFLIQGSFSTDTGLDCKSVYRLEQMGDVIVVILYQYDTVMDLTLDSKKLVIHLRQEDEDRMLSSEGMSGITVDSSDEIPTKLTELFMTNRSVFFQAGRRAGEYTMVGNGCWATLQMEKPGIYVIDSFHARKRDKTQFGINQIFGQISFMLRSDALGEKGNESTVLPKFGYGEIFDAWDQYMSFQMDKLKSQRSGHIYGYKTITVYKGLVQVELRDRIDLKPLRGIEFDYMPGKQFGYDPEHLPGEGELDILTKDRSHQTRYLGTIKNEEDESKILYFDMPPQGLLEIEGGGLLYLSGRSLEIEQRRRRKTLALIETGKSRSIRNILRLSNPNVTDIEVAGTKNPDNSFVLKQMFGTDKVELTPNYRHAMSVALNTPDIALIQGPPGTGKTTLIKGLLARLKQDDDSIKVMLSSEQHDAMYNMIDRFTDTGIMPPYVSSKKYGDDGTTNNSFERSVVRYQEICIRECEKILERIGGVERVSNLVKQLTALLVRVRECGYSRNSIAELFPQMKDLISRIGCADNVKEEFTKLDQAVNNHRRTEKADADPAKELILRKICSQRLDLDVFLEDDGVSNFDSLQSILLRQGQNDKLFPEFASSKLRSGDRDTVTSVFKDYVLYIEQLRNVYEPVMLNEFDQEDLTQYIESIRKKVSEYIDRDEYTLENIVEKFQYLLEDEEVVSTIVRKYTTIVGSTCAQAGKLQSQEGVESFDYVIIDEAARANPLDILIPLALGKKVLLVGDHKQLPHYIESQDVKEFSKGKTEDGISKTEVLTKSLFQIIYENLERAKKEGRINAERVAMIKEQHRMHPDICSFISENFYDGELKSSKSTESHLNTYGICEGKNVGFIHVPFTEGTEEFVNNTYSRPAEAKRIIKIVSDIISKNPEGKFTIGIIAYYRGQTELISEMIEDTFTEEDCDRISCGTVDSYQGKEFDIVLLSGVRCNTNYEIGFIKSEPSRINVSLSRARNLMLMICDVDTYMGSSNGNFDIFAKYFDHCRKVGYYE